MSPTPPAAAAAHRRITRWYGANLLHLLVLVASFTLTAYAAMRLFDGPTLGILYWFLGSAIVHDLALFPLYALADASLVRVMRHRPYTLGGVPWINHLRFPIVISGTLLIVWAPLIFRLPGGYQAVTSFTTEPYFERWLLITGSLFAVSAVAYAARLRRFRSESGSRPRSGSRPN